MKINTKPDAVPYCCKKPTVVPLNFRAQVKADIEADVMKGILEKVPVGELDSWCLKIVIQEKKNWKDKSTVEKSQQAWTSRVTPHPECRYYRQMYPK